jgi:hypothetical protein
MRSGDSIDVSPVGITIRKKRGLGEECEEETTIKLIR